ncbi:MAG TPA: hypothetical protein DIU11_14880 [Pusillimonas sp.]|nr:hypothetical protein [Pusillimonas sp.]
MSWKRPGKGRDHLQEGCNTTRKEVNGYSTESHLRKSIRGQKSPESNPEPLEIRAAREQAGLTQTEAGKLVYSTLRAWQRWESGERRMHPGLWELFNIKKRLTHNADLRKIPSIHALFISAPTETRPRNSAGFLRLQACIRVNPIAPPISLPSVGSGCIPISARRTPTERESCPRKIR